MGCLHEREGVGWRRRSANTVDKGGIGHWDTDVGSDQVGRHAVVAWRRRGRVHEGSARQRGARLGGGESRRVDESGGGGENAPVVKPTMK